MAVMQGKLIVIDGGDGAGKATQTGLLVERLRAEGHSVETLDFPRYTQNTFGALIRECLDGTRGDFMALDSRVVSTLFAADRFESKGQLEAWLRAGKVIILDRYVSSNMLHQGARLHDVDELETFLDWLDHVEHTIFGVPRPDLIVYLDVEWQLRLALKQQAVSEQKHGETIGIDVAEADHAHQERVEARARTITASRNQWQTVTCVESGQLRPRADIHEDVYQIVVEAIIK